MLAHHLPFKKSLNFKLTEFPRLFILLLAAWVSTMLALPFIENFWGDTGLTWGVVAGVLLQAAAVLFILARAWGVARAAWTAALVLGLAWAVEAVGSSTGLPFGAYVYTGKLQPQLAGVPLLIPLAWLMMLPPAWAVAGRLIGSQRSPAFIGLSALAFTAWDLFLDPQMVAWGLWQWTQPSGYFGVPWSNYIGWLLASAVITALARPAPLPIKPLWLIYTLTWGLETGGLLLFWGLPGPALAGCLGMGSLTWLAWSIRREKN